MEYSQAKKTHISISFSLKVEYINIGNMRFYQAIAIIACFAGSVTADAIRFCEDVNYSGECRNLECRNNNCSMLLCHYIVFGLHYFTNQVSSRGLASFF